MSDADPKNEAAPAPGTARGPQGNGAVTPVPPAPGAAPKARHARRWIAATVILLLGLVGVGAWALSLRSDNDDKDATIENQQQQLEQQQGAADQAQEAASDVAGNLEQALSGLGDQLDQIEGTADQTQEDTEAALDQAERAADDARAQADSASDELGKAQADADAAKADAEATEACARGYLSAIAGAFEASSVEEGVAQARSQIESLSGSCNGILGS